MERYRKKWIPLWIPNFMRAFLVSGCPASVPTPGDSPQESPTGQVYYYSAKRKGTFLSDGALGPWGVARESPNIVAALPARLPARAPIPTEHDSASDEIHVANTP